MWALPLLDILPSITIWLFSCCLNKTDKEIKRADVQYILETKFLELQTHTRTTSTFWLLARCVLWPLMKKLAFLSLSHVYSPGREVAMTVSNSAREELTIYFSVFVLSPHSKHLIALETGSQWKQREVKSAVRGKPHQSKPPLMIQCA